ncbi:MAG TPA: VWA domain-containing protein [Bryobacteraceae bacterium]|nr:VWA domain-containing protein [Bryobacteraceae bacterium]
MPRPRFIAALLLASIAFPQEPVTFRATSNLVIVNVEVKDRAGKPVEGLKAEDFELIENKQSQKISVFEHQRLESAAPPLSIAATPAAAPASAPLISASKPGELRYRDRRLIVLFFDLSSLAVAEQIRARKGAEDYIHKSMNESDLLAVMSFSSQLKILHDFSSDKESLLAAVKSLRLGEGSELAEGAAADETLEDTGAAFTADSSEFDIFNTDRKLGALEDAVNMLASLPEKKALVYFSSGVSRTGSENESQLRSTVNAAIRSNVAFYPIDARGLAAEAPAGNASVGSAQGDSLFTGRAQRQRRDKFNAQQETLDTLAADTGGKAMLDSNDLATGIVQAQQSFSSYYILGYYSSNPAEDGRYRRVEVKLKSPEKYKLEYRAGYYAPKTFDKYTSTDKERQLEEALRLGDPVTGLPMAIEVNWFRRAKDRYIVPVAVKIPGSVIPLARKKEREEAQLDFIAEVRDARGRTVASVRDFIRIRLSGENTGQLARKLLQYDTAFTLPPGGYRLKFVARENENGRLGTFETKFTIPDLAAEQSWLRTSSVVWGSQRIPLEKNIGAATRNDKSARNNPLVREGAKLVPSITKVIREGGELFVLFEVYEPGVTSDQGIDIEASVSLFNRKGKALESEPVVLDTKADAKTPSVPVQLRVPLANLPPGNYLCQVSVVDKASGKFAFHRTPMVILPAFAGL